MVPNSLNFVFHIEVKAKSTYKILNFVFQLIKNTKWYLGYTNYFAFCNISTFDVFFFKCVQISHAIGNRKNNRKNLDEN